MRRMVKELLTRSLVNWSRSGRSRTALGNSAVETSSAHNLMGGHAVHPGSCVSSLTKPEARTRLSGDRFYQETRPRLEN